MNEPIKTSSANDSLQTAFGAPVAELRARAVRGDASAAVARALELRSFLALAEEQVALVRDRVHQAMDPAVPMGELSADQLRMDAQWLEAALEARAGYLTALGQLLRAMPPPPTRPARSGGLAQPPTATAAPPPVAPAWHSAVADRRP